MIDLYGVSRYWHVSRGWSDELETAIMVQAESYCFPARFYPIAPIAPDERAVLMAMETGKVEGWYRDGRYLMIPQGELHAVVRELMKLGEAAYDFATAICSTLSIEVGK